MKFKPEKIIYQFNVNRKVSKFVAKEETDEDGKVREIRQKEIVDEPVLITIQKPSRFLKEEAQLFFAEKFNYLINRGILTQQMMNKKLGDNGGVFSKIDAEEYSAMLKKAGEANYTISNYLTLPEEEKDNPVEKEKFDDAKFQLQEATTQLVNYKQAVESAFSMSADALAEKSLLDWYVAHLAFYSTDNGENQIPLFKGENFEEKRNDFLFKDDPDIDAETEVEKLEKEIFGLCIDKLIRAITIWHYKYGNTTQEINSVLESLDKQDQEDGEKAE